MAFKMKGFSPFTKRQDNKKMTKQVRTNFDESSRQKQISAIDAKIEALEEDRFNEKITQEQYDKAMETLRAQEKATKKPL